MNFNVNPFQVDLTTLAGWVPVLLLLAFAVLLFMRRSFRLAGLLLCLTGFFFLFSGVSWVIAFLCFAVGLSVQFMKGGKS